MGERKRDRVRKAHLQPRQESAARLAQAAPPGVAASATRGSGSDRRRSGWRPRRRLDEHRIETNPLDDPSIPEWWETFDWDNASLCDCGRGDCYECNTRETWWASLQPHVPFEDTYGLVHVTGEHDYSALCGNMYLQTRSATSDQVQIFAAAARARHKVVTCIDCTLALMRSEA